MPRAPVQKSRRQLLRISNVFIEFPSAFKLDTNFYRPSMILKCIPRKYEIALPAFFARVAPAHDSGRIRIDSRKRRLILRTPEPQTPGSRAKGIPYTRRRFPFAL